MNTRRSLTLFIAGSIVLTGLIAVAAPPAAALPVYDFALTYVTDEQTGNVTASLSGVYSHSILCPDGWIEESATISSTGSGRRDIYRVSYVAKVLNIIHEENGTRIDETYSCQSGSLHLLTDADRVSTAGDTPTCRTEAIVNVNPPFSINAQKWVWLAKNQCGYSVGEELYTGRGYGTITTSTEWLSEHFICNSLGGYCWGDDTEVRLVRMANAGEDVRLTLSARPLNIRLAGGAEVTAPSAAGKLSLSIYTWV